MPIAPIEVSQGYEPAQVKTVVVTHRARKQVVFKLTDDSGKPVKLDAEVENPPACSPDWTPSKSATGANVALWLRSSPRSSLHGTYNLNVQGEILDQSTHRGFCSFLLEEDQTNPAGIFEAWIEREVPGPTRVDTWPVLLQIQPPTLELLTGSGPLTIPEIRLALLDVASQSDGAPFSNLLDDVEFQDLDIVYAMRRIVQKWNETPPPVACYTPMNFPYRYHWTIGACSLLLMSSAERYRKNSLAYQAGGVAIRDQDKAQAYMQAAQLKMQEFDLWMRREKARMNMNRAWGTGL